MTVSAWAALCSDPALSRWWPAGISSPSRRCISRDIAQVLVSICTLSVHVHPMGRHHCKCDCCQMHTLNVNPLPAQQLICVTGVSLSTLAGNAEGEMVAWEGDGTDITWGFAAIRVETGRMQCIAEEQPLDDQPGACTRQTTDPVQLLCRALRLAPACYRRLELKPDKWDMPFCIGGEMYYDWMDRDNAYDRLYANTPASFDSISELAAALQRCAAAEGLTVHCRLDELIVVLSRNSAEPSCWRGM